MKAALTTAAVLGLIGAILCAVVFFNEVAYSNSHPFNNDLAQQLIILAAGGVLGCVGVAVGAWAVRSSVDGS